jgi:hypothetical protein
MCENVLPRFYFFYLLSIDDNIGESEVYGESLHLLPNALRRLFKFLINANSSLILTITTIKS